MKMFPFFLLLLFCTACISRPPAKTPDDLVAVQTPTPTTVDKNDLDKFAKMIVGLDDGGTAMADGDDIRVKRARFLIEYMSNRTEESASDVARLADGASIDIERKYGLKMSRLDILEQCRKVDLNTSAANKKADLAFLMAVVVSQYSTK